MADDNVFAALPVEVQRGGGITDQVGQHAKILAQNYDDATHYDLNDPPWGEGDETAETFKAKYVQPHADLRDALHSLADAITTAGAKTLFSGKDFQGAQDDAIDALHHEGGGRH
ncbi:hypothetical protein OG552_15745 [Streptomyces sp. NBC_01476]|uniref:hypothetical protein n=1 Tax=Streptomyces sp. NBC_01476 TaxID=2903881 RepID=UPI002E30E29D|nr:hypothetical protein [Streptomyces sp. NBC_01476]